MRGKIVFLVCLAVCFLGGCASGDLSFHGKKDTKVSEEEISDVLETQNVYLKNKLVEITSLTVLDNRVFESESGQKTAHCIVDLTADGECGRLMAIYSIDFVFAEDGWEYATMSMAEDGYEALIPTWMKGTWECRKKITVYSYGMVHEYAHEETENIKLKVDNVSPEDITGRYEINIHNSYKNKLERKCQKKFISYSYGLELKDEEEDYNGEYTKEDCVGEIVVSRGMNDIVTKSFEFRPPSKKYPDGRIIFKSGVLGAKEWELKKQ